ncbi:MAG TPA: glycerophosphodiester phosphodiesterase family protein [Isosphaeraceae bacterium]|nr:glycerophosphodiester phosphodiesterase family protein [Isosphaeraceae bacterium]
MTISLAEHTRRPAFWSFRLGLILVLTGLGSPLRAQSDSEPALSRHILNVSDAQGIKNFFHYSPDRLPFVSAHRGGPESGFPENCLATFDHTLQHTWAIMEVDPHYTKDGSIVLMHDNTLDRTSTGHGRVSDHTLAEIRRLHLKDPQGNVTPYRIPTLDEALQWAKGKTILILDQKDVSAEARARVIQQHHAESYAMVMCYNFADARACYDLDPDIMMEVFIPDRASIRRFDETGVPWKNVVAFVSHNQPKDPEVFRLIHEKGAMCILGSSRTLDRDFSEGKIGEPQRDEGYRRLIHQGADIIEADLGIAAGSALESMWETKSPRRGDFLGGTTTEP